MLESLASILREQLHSLIPQTCQGISDICSHTVPLARIIANIEITILNINSTSNNGDSIAFNPCTVQGEGAGLSPAGLVRWAIATLLQVALWEERDQRLASARYLRAQARSWRLQFFPSWQVEPTALELLPLTQGLLLERTAGGNPDPSPDLLAWMKRLPTPDVGPDHDPKLRLTRVIGVPSPTAQSSGCRLEVGPSTWTLGRGFHRLLEQPGLPVDFKRALIDSLGALLSGVSIVPDILAVHLVCATADQQLVLLRRSPLVAYAPGHWTLSLEEQLTLGDFVGDTNAVLDGRSLPLPLYRAVARGAWEELGVTLSRTEQVSFLGLYLDLRVLSIGLVAMATLPQTASELQALWQSRRKEVESERSAQPTGSDAWEADALAFVPRSQLQRQVQGAGQEGLAGALGKEPLHPTALLRLRLLTRTAGFDDSATIC